MQGISWRCGRPDWLLLENTHLESTRSLYYPQPCIPLHQTSLPSYYTLILTNTGHLVSPSQLCIHVPATVWHRGGCLHVSSVFLFLPLSDTRGPYPNSTLLFLPPSHTVHPPSSMLFILLSEGGPRVVLRTVCVHLQEQAVTAIPAPASPDVSTRVTILQIMDPATYTANG